MFSSLIGGNNQDGLTGLAIDDHNNIYVVRLYGVERSAGDR